MLAENSNLSVSDISKYLQVSTVTVRTDLTGLEENGFITRTRGGALPVFHQGILDRQRYRKSEKQHIARIAAQLVADGDTIMIEAGTTTAMVAKYLLGKRDIHIVTNSTLLLPYARMNPSIHLTVTGGEFRPQTESFVGPVALRALEQFHVRLAFVGTDGFSLDKGLTTHLVEGAEIVRMMAGQAEKTILVADSSKYERAGFASVLPLSAIHCLISDKGLDAAGIKVIETSNIEVKAV